MRPPIISVIGKKKSGKTTLLEKLIPAVKARGYQVGSVKHDTHGFDIDHKGKDSWRHKQAGADATIITSPNQVGMVMKEVGIQFGYHNHNFEFLNIDGVIPYYDIFMPEMDADLITMEIDLYWVTKAGQDPVEMFNKYPGRFQLFHLKDMYEETEPYFEVIKDDIAPVGAGLIDFKRIMAASETAGMKYFFVEDDNQGNGKPFEGIQTSIDNVTGKKLILGISTLPQNIPLGFCREQGGHEPLGLFPIDPTGGIVVEVIPRLV